MTKVRHWHSKHVFSVLLEGLKIGPANVLLSIVLGVSILHRNVGERRCAAWMWSLQPSLIKLARKFWPGHRRAAGCCRGSGRPAGKPQVSRTPRPQGGESSGYQRRERHPGMAWLDSALFAHGVDGERLRPRQPRHKTAGQKHGNTGGFARDGRSIDPGDVDFLLTTPSALLSQTQCSCDAPLARCGFSGSWPSV